MNPESLILTGGLLHVAVTLFHLAFWKLFRWKEQLARLTSLNRAVVQTLNLTLSGSFALFAWISLAYPSELAASPLGRALLLSIALLWLFRAALQIVLFGLRKGASWAMLLFSLAVAALYGAAWRLAG